MYKPLFILFIMVLSIAACSPPPKGVMPTNAEPAGEELVGDAARGEMLFKNGTGNAPACSTCHITQTVTVSTFALAPNLSGIAERAGERIEGMGAEAYIRESIIHPAAFLADGFRNSMYFGYGERLSPQDVTDLIAYLLTL